MERVVKETEKVGSRTLETIVMDDLRRKAREMMQAEIIVVGYDELALQLNVKYLNDNMFDL